MPVLDGMAVWKQANNDFYASIRVYACLQKCDMHISNTWDILGIDIGCLATVRGTHISCGQSKTT